MSDGDMTAYRDVFLSESAEFIQAVTDGLLALESKPDDLEPVEVVFRGAHSLKGMAAAMGYDRTAELTHSMESLMDTVRARSRAVDAALVDLMLEAVDAVKALIEDESSGGTDVDAAPLIERIVALTEGRGDAGSHDAAAAEEPTSASGANGDLHIGERAFLVRVTLEEGCVLKAVRAYMVLKRLGHMGHVLDTVPSARDIEDERFESEFSVLLATRSELPDIRDAVMAVSEVHEVEAVEHDRRADEETADAQGDRVSGTARRVNAPRLSDTQTVRIAIGHLDTMVDLVGELVILRSRLERIAGSHRLGEMTEALEELHRVAGELQHEVMRTRMVPVGNIFNRFPRMVRDLARDLGKEIEFELSGLDIELDRTVLDEIGDPIVHLLRNAIDHGIEPSAERLAAGKPAQGLVRLSAARDRDLVKVTVTDDGRGIDFERVWEKACGLGVADPHDRESYTQSDILQFTCLPGFSTAESATKVSGRGVGMDVVKGKIEYLGGTLTIRSHPGEGTEFSLTLPLTLAIIQALMVRTRGNVFALPLSAVDEVFAPDEVEVDSVDGSPVVVYRDGTLVPVFSLAFLLGDEEDGRRRPRSGEHIVLVNVAGTRKSLLVDELLGRREIVIKPLSRLIGEVRGYGGATVLGDGKVALILDPRTIFLHREEAR